MKKTKKPDPRTIFIDDINPWCISSSYLSSCLRKFLEKNGFKVTRDRQNAGVVVVNGCNIVPRNPEIARNCLLEAKTEPGKKFIAFGCAPLMKEKLPGNFHVLPYAKLLRHTDAVGRILGSSKAFSFRPADEMLANRRFPNWEDLALDPSELFYLRISDGCTGRCAYCAIRRSKGAVKSVPAEEIVRRFSVGRKKGFKKFVLLADDATCWGADIRQRRWKLPELLKLLVETDPSCELIISSFNPAMLKPWFRKMSPYFKNIRYLFASIQSGNDRILGLMRRGYTIKPVLETVARIKKINPEITLVTHVIAGFPTETRKEFLDSIRAAAHFDQVWLYRFVPYPGTAAFTMPGKVPPEETRSRIAAAMKTGGPPQFRDAGMARDRSAIAL